jgi:uncharacterized coiled-coil protein SlyX
VTDETIIIDRIDALDETTDALDERLANLSEAVTKLAQQLDGLQKIIAPMVVRFAEVTGVRTAPAPVDEQQVQIDARAAERRPPSYGRR